MEDQTVLGGIVFGLEGSEESFLCTEDLNGTRRVFGKVHQASSVTDEACADKFSYESCEIGSYRVHTIAEVFGELRAIRRDGDDLFT